jgi:hypothetical protein
MSALVQPGLVPRSYLLTTRAARPAGHAPTRWSRWSITGDAGWSHPMGPCPWVRHPRATGWVRHP